MKISAAEFTAQCLSLIDFVQSGGEVEITKRGRVVAKLIGESSRDDKPWLALRRQPARWKGDPLSPTAGADDD